MATIDSLANETLCKIMGMLKEPPLLEWSLSMPPGRYDALRAAALVSSRWRDPAQQALCDKVEITIRFPARSRRLLSPPGPPHHRTRVLWASGVHWHDVLAVAEVCKGLQHLEATTSSIHWSDLARPCFAGLQHLSFCTMEFDSDPLLPGHTLPVGLTSLALWPMWTNYMEPATAFLAATSSASKHSLKKLHFRIVSKQPTFALHAALSNIGSHLQSLVVESDSYDAVERVLDIFPMLQSLESLSWHGENPKVPLKASDAGYLRTILDAFPSPATLTHLSIGTGDFPSLGSIIPLLNHPTLSLLTELDFPSLPPLPSSAPRNWPRPIAIAAMTRACENGGIRWSLGGVGV